MTDTSALCFVRFQRAAMRRMVRRVFTMARSGGRQLPEQPQRRRIVIARRFRVIARYGHRFVLPSDQFRGHRPVVFLHHRATPHIPPSGRPGRSARHGPNIGFRHEPERGERGAD